MISKRTGITGDKINTVIGVRTVIDGNIVSEGLIRIDGNVNGDINVEGTVYIGDNAHIKGNITADDVHLSGTVEGNITAKGMLKLLSTARLYGNIKVQSLVVEEGSIFQGASDMLNQEATDVSPNPVKTEKKNNKKVLEDVYKEKEREKQESAS